MGCLKFNRVCASAPLHCMRELKLKAGIKAGGTPQPMNQSSRLKGIPNKVTPSVAGMLLQMRAEQKKVAHIARELNLSRQTM